MSGEPIDISAVQQVIDPLDACFINVDIESKYSYLVRTDSPPIVKPEPVSSTPDASATPVAAPIIPPIPPKPPNLDADAIAAIRFDIDPTLTDQGRDVMQRMLVTTLHAFANNPKVAPTPSPGVSHSINLTDPHPIRQAAYRQSPAKQATVESTVAELLARNLIRPSNSAWSSPIVLAPKPDGSWRMCIDYRRVNHHTKKDAYPTPDIRDCLNLCKNADFLTLVDIKDAYHHIEMDPASIPITSFITPRGLFEWTRMPFGLCNAPATFQRYVDNCLRGLLGKTCAAFFDDCAVYTTGSIEQHALDVKAVLERLATAGLEANIKKCRFGYKEMLFIGHIVSKGTIKPDPAKVSAVQNFPVPTNLSTLRSFLGLSNYYHDFIHGFAHICVPLYRLTRKDVPFVWCANCVHAFATLKAALLSSTCLYAPNFTLPFILQTDASGDGIGAVLAQVVNGKEHPIGYISRQLSKHEKNYSATEWECLAVVWAIGQFEVYLIDAPFTVVTDHAALQWLPTKKMGNSRLQRWAMTLAEFKFTVVHRPGKLSANVDSLSRSPVEGSAPMDESIDPPVAPGERVPHHVRVAYTRFEPMPHYVRTGDLLSYPFDTLDFSATRHFKMHPARVVLHIRHNPPSSSSSSSAPPSESFRGAPVHLNRIRSSNSSSSLSSSSRSAPVASTPNWFEANSEQLSGVSIVDLNQLDKVIDAQYEDKQLKIIIQYKTDKHIPMTYDEASKKRLIAMSYNYVLMDQPPPLRPALFYFPSRPRRGLSSLVPIVPRLVVPKSMHRTIIELFHKYAFGGHFGERRTMRKIMTNYYWDTLLADVIKYVQGCEECQKEKIQRRRPDRPMGRMESPTHPFELISMDFVGPMPERSGDFQHILVICDHFTRWSITIPCVDQSAETVARALVNEVYCKFGMPKRLLSDRGSQFHGTLIRELNSYLRVNQLFTSAHHPKTNGLCERFNATLKDMLSTIHVEFPSNWIDALQGCTFAYNTSVHEATGMTPFYALYGFEATTPGDAVAITAAEHDVDVNIPTSMYNVLTLDALQRSQDWIRSLQDSKRDANLQARLQHKRFPVYAVGDLVYVRDDKSDTETGQGKGHVTPFKGPYTIVRRLGEFAYEVRLNTKRANIITVNVDRLKPYHRESTLPVSESEELLPLSEPEVSSPIPHAGRMRERSEFGAALAEEHDDNDTPMSSSALPLPAVPEDDPSVPTAMIDVDEPILDPTPPPLVSADSSSSSSAPDRYAGPAGAAHARTSTRSRAVMDDHYMSRHRDNVNQRSYTSPSAASRAQQEARRVNAVLIINKLYTDDEQSRRRARAHIAEDFTYVAKEKRTKHMTFDSLYLPSPSHPSMSHSDKRRPPPRTLPF